MKLRGLQEIKREERKTNILTSRLIYKQTERKLVSERCRQLQSDDAFEESRKKDGHRDQGT